MTDFEAVTFFVDLDGIHRVAHIDVIELLAIAAPTIGSDTGAASARARRAPFR
jgi:hypothetical protein